MLCRTSSRLEEPMPRAPLPPSGLQLFPEPPGFVLCLLGLFPLPVRPLPHPIELFPQGALRDGG